MVRAKNMHTDLQISSCWEHISTWNMLSKGTTVFEMNFQENIFFTNNWCNINLKAYCLPNRNCFIPKIIVVNDLFKLWLNSYATKDTICVLFFGEKRPKNIVIGIIVHDDKNSNKPDPIHIAFYVNPYWACALIRNNTQHVEESGLWRIQR
jgi:hypothetical protein